MPVTDEARRELYHSLVDALGQSPAQTFMELTEAMDPDRFATKDDFSALRAEVSSLALRMEERFEQVDQRFEQVDQRFERMEKRFARSEEGLERLDERLHSLYLRLISVVWAFAGILLIGFLSVIAAIIATR